MATVEMVTLRLATNVYLRLPLVWLPAHEVIRSGEHKVGHACVYDSEKIVLETGFGGTCPRIGFSPARMTGMMSLSRKAAQAGS